MSEEFCVVCGQTSQPVAEGVCPACFAERHALVTAPERAVTIVCPTCGARKVGAHWEGRGRSPGQLRSEDLLPLLSVHPEVAVRTVHWTDDSHHPLLRDLTGSALVRFRGTERIVPLALTVRLEHRTCPECSRRSGHFYTATIQLRGLEERLREKPRILRERLRTGWDSLAPVARSEWLGAVSWSEELPEGIDLFLTDTLAARALARLAKARLGARLKESATLWGRKDGHDVYRVTFCLRVPPPPSVGRPAEGGRGSPPGGTEPRAGPSVPGAGRA